MAKNEKKVQNQILKDLESFGEYCECFKIMKANKNGEPDVFFTFKLTGGILVECKRLLGVPRRLQLVKIMKLNRCGTPTYVCHSWKEWCELKQSLGITKESVIRAHNVE